MADQIEKATSPENLAMEESNSENEEQPAENDNFETNVLNEAKEFRISENEKFDTMKFNHLMRMEAEIAMKAQVKEEMTRKRLELEIEHAKSELDALREDVVKLQAEKEEYLRAHQLMQIEEQQLQFNVKNIGEIVKLSRNQCNKLYKGKENLKKDIGLVTQKFKLELNKFNKKKNDLLGKIKNLDLINVQIDQEMKHFQSEFENESTTVCSNINSLKIQISDTKATLAGIKQSNDDQLSDLKVKEAKRDSLRQSIKETKEKTNAIPLQELQKQLLLINIKNESLKSAENEIGIKKAQLEEYTNINKSKGEKLHEAEKLQEKYQNQLAEVDRKRVEQETKFKQLENHNRKLQEQAKANANLKLALEGKQTEIVCLENESSNLKSKYDLLLNECDALKENNAKLDYAISDKKTKVNAALEEREMENADLNIELNEKRSLVKTRQEELIAKTENHKKVKENLEILRKQLENAKDEMIKVKSDTTETNEILKYEIERALFENNRLNEKIEKELVDEIEDMKKQLDSSNKELMALKSRQISQTSIRQVQSDLPSSSNSGGQIRVASLVRPSTSKRQKLDQEEFKALINRRP